jgi:hypothetical protein
MPARTMKTERRHELQTNILADWLGHKTEAIRPYFKLILGGIAAVLIVAIVATVISNQQLERSSQGWADYFAASTGDSTDRLRTVAEEHAGTLPAVWATLREADLELARGIRALYTSRGESTEAIGTARRLYSRVAAGAAGLPDLRQAAQFGTAQAFEAEGEVDKAKDYYQQAIALARDSSIGKQAQLRLDRLSDKDAAQWLAWFARQTPQPRTSPGGFPGGGFPGGFPGGADDGLDLPRDLSEIPGRPDLSLPLPFEGTNQRAESSLPSEDPTATTPASEGAEPKGTEPETKKPEATDPAATTPDSTTPESTASEPATSVESAPTPKAPAADKSVETPADPPSGDGAASQ